MTLPISSVGQVIALVVLVVAIILLVSGGATSQWLVAMIGGLAVAILVT